MSSDVEEYKSILRQVFDDGEQGDGEVLLEKLDVIWSRMTSEQRQAIEGCSPKVTFEPSFLETWEDAQGLPSDTPENRDELSREALSVGVKLASLVGSPIFRYIEDMTIAGPNSTVKVFSSAQRTGTEDGEVTSITLYTLDQWSTPIKVTYEIEKLWLKSVTIGEA